MKSRWVPGPVNLNWGLGPVNLSWGLGAGNLNWGLTEIKFVTASPVVDLRSHPMPIKAISWRFGWNNDSEVLRYLGCVQHALWDALHGTDGAAADDARVASDGAGAGDAAVDAAADGAASAGAAAGD